MLTVPPVELVSVPALLKATAVPSPATSDRETSPDPTIAKLAPARLLITAPASRVVLEGKSRSQVAAPWLFSVVSEIVASPRIDNPP